MPIVWRTQPIYENKYFWKLILIKIKRKSCLMQTKFSGLKEGTQEMDPRDPRRGHADPV